MLIVKDLKKTYHLSNHDVPALKGLNFELKPGNLVAIVGPSGCGKTSLMNILGALDSDFEGDVVINNKSLKEAQGKDIDSHRKNTVGFIFQHFTLINSLNGLENVELAFDISNVSKKERRQRAIQLLDQVGLKEHMKKKVNRLSGGQKQRVAIARALANNPDIILADEPTGALDQQTGIQVMEILKEIAKERLVIMVTHSPELAGEYANQIIVMKDGEIVDHIENKPGHDASNIVKKETKSNMSFLTALRLSYRNLWFKKGRTIWTAIGLSIGIIGIALALALTTGTKQVVQDQVMQIFPASNVFVSQKSNDELDIKSVTDPSFKMMTHTDIDPVLALSDRIDGYMLVPNEIVPSLASTNKDFANIQNFSENRESFDPLPPFFFITNITSSSTLSDTFSAGRLPNVTDDGTLEIVIAQSTAEKLVGENGRVTDLIDQPLYFSISNFRSRQPEVKIVEAKIVGVSAQNTLLDVLYMNPETTFSMLDTYFGIKKEDIKAPRMLVFMNDTKDITTYTKELTDSQSTYRFESVAAQILGTVDNILNMVRNGLIAFSSVSVVVAILMIAIVIYISVLERQREIGIIRAIGGRKKDIRNMFISESLGIGFLSGVLGVSVAYGITITINTLVTMFLRQTNPNIPAFNVAQLPLETAAILIGLCMLIAVIAGLIPSLRAANLDPVESIRKR